MDIIRPMFTAGMLRQHFAKLEKKVDLLVVREMQVLGEKIVNLCRDLDTYQDDTGNLRSSIGYVLYVDFKAYKSNFVERPGKGSTTGETGKLAGEDLVAALKDTIVSSYYSLVIVAGMDYAEEVEARNYAVLSPGQELAEIEIPKIKQRIIAAFKKAKF